MLERSEKVAMAKSNIFLDTDVILNWLTKEVDQNTGFKLWKCPYEIMKFVENGEINAYTSITNLFEIRFVLRRKKKCPEIKIKNFVSNLYDNITIEIPDYVDLLTANKLQDNYAFDPFDSIALGIVQSMPEESILVSRDGAFRELSAKCGIKAETPEKYMEIHFPKVFELIKIELY